MSGGWVVVLDGVALDGGGLDSGATLGFGEGNFGTGGFGEAEASGVAGCIDESQVKGCLSDPPDGLGLPPLRTEDVAYPQRDGVRHFSDWYEPRIVTLAEVEVNSDDCPGCSSARRKVRDITQAWRRRCDDVELVVYTDCHGADPDRSLVGPFGIVGRPRAAPVAWRGQGSKSATLTLRFDARDHLMYVLDECGTPGSGGGCTLLDPDTLTLTRCYTEGDGTQRCYPRCYTVQQGEGGGPMVADNIGTECVPMTITLAPTLTNPFVENLTTGERLDYDGLIASGQPVVIDTGTGTATQGGQSRTHLISGDIRMLLQPGLNTLRLGSFNAADTGTAEVCWRPAVVQA